jgi:hypothetical protein
VQQSLFLQQVQEHDINTGKHITADGSASALLTLQRHTSNLPRGANVLLFAARVFGPEASNEQVYQGSGCSNVVHTVLGGCNGVYQAVEVEAATAWDHHISCVLCFKAGNGQPLDCSSCCRFFLIQLGLHGMLSPLMALALGNRSQYPLLHQVCAPGQSTIKPLTPSALGSLM